jgi:SET domain-containing protein
MKTKELHENIYMAVGDQVGCIIVGIVNKNGEKQIGSFVTREIKSGEIIHKLEGDIIENPTKYSIQIGRKKHIESKVGACINHSCHPNIKVHNSMLVAIKNIQKGEEITFNYNDNEDFLASPFKCSCCKKIISGAHGNAYIDAFNGLSRHFCSSNRSF